jgi:hypothetical protein
VDRENGNKFFPSSLQAQAWTYVQKTGELEQNGSRVAIGYSGFGAGKNNPQMDNVANIGPIPHGEWTICGPPTDTIEHGPYVLRLDPAPNTETFGRSGFLMHGDSKESPGCASRGCLIFSRPQREQVWNSGDRDLKVVPEIAQAPSK